MKTYLLRFNTHHATSDRPDLVWRIFEDGVEHLVKQVSITTEVTGVSSEEFGVTKWNIGTKGYMEIRDDVTYITSTPPAVFDLDAMCEQARNTVAELIDTLYEQEITRVHVLKTRRANDVDVWSKYVVLTPEALARAREAWGIPVFEQDCYLGAGVESSKF